MIIKCHWASPTWTTSIWRASAKASCTHYHQCSALIATTLAALSSRTPSHSGSISVLCGIRCVVWVDLSVWFSVHEGRSFNSDISYVPSKLRHAYVLADGIFYLPKQFDLVLVIPWVYHGFGPRISSNSFWPSFVSPGITDVHSQCVSFSLSFWDFIDLNFQTPAILDANPVRRTCRFGMTRLQVSLLRVCCKEAQEAEWWGSTLPSLQGCWEDIPMNPSNPMQWILQWEWILFCQFMAKAYDISLVVSGYISTPGLSILNHLLQVACSNALGRLGMSLQAHKHRNLWTAQKTLLHSALVSPACLVWETFTSQFHILNLGLWLCL